MTKHKFKKGEIHWAIAKKYRADGNRYREIMKANGLTDEVIHPDMVLTIPDNKTSQGNYEEIGKLFAKAATEVDKLESVQKLYKLLD